MRRAASALLYVWCAGIALLLCTRHLAAQATSADDDPNAPVRAALVVTPRDTTLTRPIRVGDTVTVTVTLVIADGWHVYKSAGSAGQRAMTLTLDTTSAARPAGEWRWPTPKVVFEGQKVELYYDVQRFTRSARVTSAEPGAVVRATVVYQACTEVMCGPPTTLSLAGAVSGVEIPAASNPTVAPVPTL